MTEGPHELAGRVALVTGSTTGLGRCMAKALGQAGAKVALNYANNAQRAQKAFAEFQAEGLQGALFQADVTDEVQVQRMVTEIQATLGAVDIMVLNATCEQPQKPIEEYDWAFYQRMVDFFIKSPVLLTKATVGHMKAQRWGRIINIGSEVVARGVPNFTAYVAAKGGQNGFHRSLAGELAPHGITVNCIAPGHIDSEQIQRNHSAAFRQDQIDNHIPMRRYGQAQDLAHLVCFLASDVASYITGTLIPVDGGLRRYQF